MEEIIVFRKSDEHSAEDAVAGVARIGGKWRTPDYLTSYGTAAALLLVEAERLSKLDELALPIFYMLRHATELALKYLRDQAREIEYYSAMLTDEALPEVKLEFTHHWSKLIEDSETALRRVGYQLPDDLRRLALRLEEFEDGCPERSRYREVKLPKIKGKDVVASLPDEVTIPLRDLVHGLNGVLKHFAFDQDDPPLAYEMSCVWSGIMGRLAADGKM